MSQTVVRQHIDNDTAKVVMAGNATFLRLPRLIDALESAAASGKPRIRLDLTGVTHLDHACRSQIDEFVAQHRGAGLRVELLMPGPAVTGAKVPPSPEPEVAPAAGASPSVSVPGADAERERVLASVPAAPDGEANRAWGEASTSVGAASPAWEKERVTNRAWEADSFSGPAREADGSAGSAWDATPGGGTNPALDGPATWDPDQAWGIDRARDPDQAWETGQAWDPDQAWDTDRPWTTDRAQDADPLTDPSHDRAAADRSADPAPVPGPTAEWFYLDTEPMPGTPPPPVMPLFRRGRPTTDRV
jgi:hypothetical protein